MNKKKVRKRFIFVLPEGMKDYIKWRSKKENVSMSKIVRDILIKEKED